MSAKQKGSSSDSGSSSESSSSDSEDSETGKDDEIPSPQSRSSWPLLGFDYDRAVDLLFNSGMAPKLKKRGHAAKEGKKGHHPVIAPSMVQPQMPLQPQAPVLQPTVQLKQQQQHNPSPAAYMAPVVTALESSQLLENTFDSLPHFGQPVMHMPHHANDSSSPAPPHLNAHTASGSGSPDTHPFLNQHPILQSPGMSEVSAAVIC